MCLPRPELGHLFGLLLPAAVAVPPHFQSGHQAGQQETRGQDAEDAGEAVQFERAAIRLGVAVAVEVTATGPRPPLLLQDIQISFLLQLQNPVSYKKQRSLILARKAFHQVPYGFPTFRVKVIFLLK